MRNAVMPRQALEDRRKAKRVAADELERQLTDAQLAAVRALERLGWELRFLRRPPFLPSIPVVFDRRRERYAVIEPDGMLNEHPGIELRH
jgi:hypothetical protein